MADNNEEERRQRNEINMFAAMALGADDAITGESTAATTTTTTTAYDAGSLMRPQPPPPQQQQNAAMSAFAAAAGGNPSSIVGGGRGDTNTKTNNEDDGNSSSNSSSIRNMFSQAAQASAEMDSGTFAMRSSSSSSAGNNNGAGAGDSNLAAAALALGLDDDDGDGDPAEDGNNTNNHRGRGGGPPGGAMLGQSLLPPGHLLASSSSSSSSPEGAKYRKMTEDHPMYAEEVRMPRPLFFGPIVPPRVLMEAKAIVKEALLEQQRYNDAVAAADPDSTNNTNTNNKNNSPPRLSSLPPEVQNIVGALRTYGFGLSPFPGDTAVSNSNSDELNKGAAIKDRPDWKGSSYVKTFQPVFGDTARMLRHKTKDDLSSSSSHPSESNHSKDEKDANQPLTSRGGRPSASSQLLSTSDTTATEVDSTSTTATSSLEPRAPMTETEKANASFLANISGGMAPGSTVNARDDSPPPTTTPAAITPITAKKPASSDDDDDDNPANNEISMFSMWARGEGAVDDTIMNDNGSPNGSLGSAGSYTAEQNGATAGATKVPTPMSDQDLFSQWARGESPSQSSINNNNKNGTFKNTSDVKNAFAVQEKTTSKKAALPRFGSDAFGTFQRTPITKLDNDSDDDSIVGSEMKKKVGANEHLDAALASLADDGGPTDGLDRDDEMNNTMLQMTRATPGGRPLSNLELTNGCVPIYGIDDSPLPVIDDLGIHETKTDEQRTQEQNRSQDLIEKYVGPNLFGTVACPNPATGPGDNHSWNSRAIQSQRYNVGTGINAHQSAPDRAAVLPVPTGSTHQSPKASSRKSTRHASPKSSSRSRHHPSSTSSTSATPITRKTSNKTGASTSHNKRGGRSNTRNIRYGWWSIPADQDTGKGLDGAASAHSTANAPSRGIGTTGAGPIPETSPEECYQLPPMHHTSFNLQFDTRLQPSPEQLRDENLPLSELHGATHMAHGLPYLSDRPPSYRYLQIDTQAVGFPPLGGEVEPLFCSLSIYNVETISVGPNDATPLPDLQRCGRVTEVLNFDVVSDQNVENSCIGSLWPFFSSSTMTPQSSKSTSGAPPTIPGLSENPSLQGTRCGVFPLPSNLNVANLYAVLTVQKVLSEDSDFEIYLKQSKSNRSSGGIDMSKFRANAEKASNQHGSFLMPFAFGVAPLLQVFGADNPEVASSRAVQIPLFRFYAGLGDRQIIDHIMVMLFPRADFRANGIGGPAAVTNGGTAMLVMRNFGYLGLHAVVHSRSSLARDRLVDFTGELQIRRRNESDPAVVDDSVVKTDEHAYVVPEWHTQFISEPTINGGRNSVDPAGIAADSSKLKKVDDNPSRSPLYAQELASLPLSSVPFPPATRPLPNSVQPRARAPVNRGDIEPSYHTSYCNELLCHPRLLHNCPKGNIVMKVEMREMEWKQEHNAFFAHLPQHGPSVHNTRRGPFLIQGTYTSCAVRTSDPNFLDEVKVKLPLELKSKRTDGSARTLSLFFSVYHVKFSSKKKKWSKVIPLRTGSKKRDSSVSGVNDINEATGERTDCNDEGGLTGKCKLVLLSCGFLPVTSQACLVENGLHDVKMVYKGSRPSTEMRGKGIPPSSLVVKERNETSVYSQRESQASSGFDLQDDTTAGSSRTHSEAEQFPGEESESSYSDGYSALADRFGSGALTADALTHAEATQKSKASPEQMTLQVRIIVHSSIHAQNPVLCDFLQKESDTPTSATKVLGKMSSETLKLDRDEMIKTLGASVISSSRLTPPKEESLLDSVSSLAKPQMCSTSQMSTHLLRVTTKLWKTFVFGTGDTDLTWANPAAIMPLRVHAFGSLLQIIGNVSLYMLKSGVTQVEGGTSKFDMVTLGNVLALLFDEEAIFGHGIAEVLGDSDLWLKSTNKANGAKNTDKSTTSSEPDTSPATEESTAKPKRKNRHQRHTFEFRTSVDVSDPTSALSDFSFGASSGPTSRGRSYSAEETSTPSSVSLPKPSIVSRSRTAPSSGIDTKAGSDLDMSHLSPPSRPKSSLKADSVADFKSNMEIGLSENTENSFDDPLTASNVNSLMQKFGGMSGAGKNRWRTAPAPNLMTIREDEPPTEEPPPLPPTKKLGPDDGPEDSVASEMVLQQKKTSTKQMRVPKIGGKAAHVKDFDLSTISSRAADSSHTHAENNIALSMVTEKAAASSNKYNTLSGPPGSARQSPIFSTPKTEEEIFSAGNDFLDSIGSNFGLSDGLNAGSSNGGGHHKTRSLHRKTRSRCSIDWNNLGSDTDGILQPKPKSKDVFSSAFQNEAESDEHDETMSTLHLENENCMVLPNFADRLVALGKTDDLTGRWFPYSYEVIIMIWTAFLVQQRASGDRMGSSGGAGSTRLDGAGNDCDANLAEAASSTHRVVIACAPFLFEVIKQSLAGRVKTLSQKLRAGKDKCRCPPLAVLDETLQATLEHLITMITDACLDSRNFDSRDMRQLSIDVNDSIVKFLRDMFAFLKPASAYRLVSVYLARFVTKDGKQWQDRDSSIGLRCSWEITKLRLNAMTALIRFPDFLRVCSPQMNTWGSSWSSLPSDRQDSFFSSVLDHYKRLEMPEFVKDGAFQGSEVKIPPIRPHWLVELATEICLQGTEHAEQYIQMRAASLLHELFWSSSQHSMAQGTSQVVASMYITFLDKVLLRSSYLSNFAPKSQLRKDILPCVLFILQGAPSGLLRAQWRKLCVRAQGNGSSDRFGGIGVSMFGDTNVRSAKDQSRNTLPVKNDPDILDMFTLLNMSLSTVEYEGCEDLLESDSGEHDDQLLIWHKEYLLSRGQQNQQPFMGKSRSQMRGGRMDKFANGKSEKSDKGYFTSGSRKWQAYDASMVAINCSSQIVSELSAMLESSYEGQFYLEQKRRTSTRTFAMDLPFGNFEGTPREELKFSRSDTVIFVRAAASLYLHSLALRQSDIALVRTFKVSADLIKIFGIKLFLEAVGETLQHWMRVVSLHCGARRAKVRIEATDFLELILRCTWETYGSFFRIRVPFLAVQTEVMERIVAIAAGRYYREERESGSTFDNFSNASAEASLAPLWRTLDRLHHQSASQNIAFKGALVRLAVKLKKLYRAYIAARALSYLNGMQTPKHSGENGESDKGFSDTDALVRAYRITVLRVINASAGYSKQFLGFHGTSLSSSTVAHYEAVEDAFLDAADVFSPTELPEHRVAWLQMLADFHATRSKRAEEGTCHFQIHATLKQASLLHGSLWSNTPFLPWTNSPHDPVHIDGDAPSGGNPLDYASDLDFDEIQDNPYGNGTNSSRRIFYRVANSVRANTEDWETGQSKTLFCGVTFAAEYCSVSSWITLREMEEKMVEEAEIAGELFLQSGIIESSRYAWNLATEYYSSKFMYAKLGIVYGCLAKAVVSQVPPIDASQHQEVSISVGCFYRVWFHGGAPDELIGAEFVYRTASWIRLDQFGEHLREVIQCIIPDRTPIHLVLDGRADESSQRSYGGFSRLGPAPLEPVRIKVTPLRPLFAKGAKIRGLPEWFHRYVDEAMARVPSRQSTKRQRGGPRGGLGDGLGRLTSPGHRGNNLSFGSSASVFASGGSSASGSMLARRSSLSRVTDGNNRGANSAPSSVETDLVGVDKFGFLQPVHHKDRIRGNKDWWKPSSGDFAQKSLKVTQLQVRQHFPACVTRQAVVHRVVFTLSPLEAGVDGVCQWCSVLFRTAVATNGMSVLRINPEPGIGTHAAKVVADCIHSSRVKEIGLSLLKKNGSVAEDTPSDIFQSSDRLTEDEVNKFQQKLARTIVVFLELLHLLIARNRDLLLNVIQERRKESSAAAAAAAVPPPTQPIARAQTATAAFSSNPRGLMRPSSFNERDSTRDRFSQSVTGEAMRSRHTTGEDRPRSHDRSRSYADDQSYSGASLAGGAGNVRTDSAIAVQSELQRAFISLTKALYPGISGIMQGESPRWLRQCCQENYFSLGTYRQTKISISEELYFSSVGEATFQGVPPPRSGRPDHMMQGGLVGGLGGLPNNLSHNNLTALGNGSGHREHMESPAGSVASSAYSRNSGNNTARKSSKASENEF